MSSESQPKPTPRWMFWTGWAITALLTAGLIFSGVMKFIQPAGFEEEFGTKLGWDVKAAVGLGILEITCVLIYVFPRTSVLGAILLTGYLGGAIATHVRIGDPFYGPFIGGVLVWLSIYLRDARVRALFF